MTDKFSFGVTVKYIDETLADVSMGGVLIDLGTYYWTGLGTTRFAVSVTNFGGQLTPSGTATLVDGLKFLLFKASHRRQYSGLDLPSNLTRMMLIDSPLLLN